MAKQVEGISEKVELCAKKEFLEKGYVDASLRTIAAEAGTTTGTIYSRYGGKEGLFSAIPHNFQCINLLRHPHRTNLRSNVRPNFSR